jgi:hypothetical protein
VKGKKGVGEVAHISAMLEENEQQPTSHGGDQSTPGFSAIHPIEYFTTIRKRLYEPSWVIHNPHVPDTKSQGPGLPTQQQEIDTAQQFTGPHHAKTSYHSKERGIGSGRLPTPFVRMAHDVDGPNRDEDIRPPMLGSQLHEPESDFARPQASLTNRSGDSGIVHQPETRPISQEQSVPRLKRIYGGLVMVEGKCIQVDLKRSALDPEGPKPS